MVYFELRVGLQVLILRECKLSLHWLVKLGEHRFAEREVTGSNPGQNNTQGLKITEKKVLPL